MTVQQLIRNKASKCDDRTFLIFPENGEELSFAKLQERVMQLTAQLEAMDTEKGDHIALLMENGQWTVSLLLAIMASGRVAVPLDITEDEQRVKEVFTHSDAKVLFASEQQLERARALCTDTKTDIKLTVVKVDDGPQWEAEIAAAALLPTIESDIPALLLYTTGNTDGVPNGVLLTHRNLLAGASNTIQAHSLSSEDRALCVLPLYYINAMVVTVIAPLLSGGSVVMPQRFSNSAFWDLLGDYKCTWFSIVPTIVDYLLARHKEQPADVLGNSKFKQVRFGRSASSALQPDAHQTFEQTFGIPLIETMGSTKTAAQILSNPLPPFQSKYGSPGIAYKNEVMVVRNNGREAHRGEIGELLVRGDNVMLTFYKNPAATEKYLMSDGWLRTGDLGYQDETGFFFITGRD